MANRDFEIDLRMKADFASVDRASERTIENIRKISDVTAQANAEAGGLGSGVAAGAGAGGQIQATDALTASQNRNAKSKDAINQAAFATQRAVTAEIGLISELQSRLERGASSADDLADTEARLDAAMSKGLITAEEYDEALEKLNQEQVKLTRENEKAGRTIDTTIGRYDKAGAGLRRLQADEDRLKRAVDSGRISREAYNRALSGISAERTRLTALRDGATQSASAMRLLNFETVGAQRNLAQMVQYAATGQWQLAGSQILQMGSSAGAAGALFSAAGLAIGATAAAVGVLTLAWYQGEQQQAKFNQALILTGNYAQTTADELYALANRLDDAVDGATTGSAAETITSVVETGKFTGEQIELVSRAAEQMRDTTGRAIEDTVADFVKLAGAPVDAIIELNDKYHFLTQAQLDNIIALKNSGRETEAVTEAFRVYSGSIDERTPKLIENLGLIESSWRGIKNSARETWDEMVTGLHKADVAATESVKNFGNILAALRMGVATPFALQAAGQGNGQFTASAVAPKPTSAPANGKKTLEDDAKRKAAVAEFDRLAISNLSKTQQLEREIAQIRATGKLANKGELEIEKQIAAARERYKESLPKAPKAPKSEAQKDQDAAQRELENLQKQVALLGEVADGQDKASEAARIRYEVEQGAYKGASESVKRQLLDAARALDASRASADAKKEEAKAQAELEKSFGQLQDALRTPTEVALDTAVEQVTLLNEALQKGVTDKAAYDLAMGRIVTGAFAKPPEFEGLAPEVGGAQGEIGKTFKAQAELEKWYAEQLALLAKFRSQRSELNAQWDLQEQALTVQHQNAVREIESARQQASVAAASATFGQLADIAKAYGGEQNKTYRALFALSKAFAAAQAAVALVNNISKASEAGFPRNIPLIAGAFAQGAQIAALLSGANFQGGGTGYATGGHVRGPGTGTSDSINARLSDYEYITRAGIVRQPGALAFLEDFNSRGMGALYQWAQFADGGLARSAARPSLAPPRWDRAPAANDGGSSAPTVALRNVVVLDPAELASAMGGGAGETMVMTHVKANLPTIRQMVTRGAR